MAEIGLSGVTVGGLLSTSFRILLRNLLPFGIIALVITAIPVLIQLALEQSYVVDPEALPNDHSQNLTSLAGWGIAWWFLSLVFGQFLTATLIFGTVQDLRGERVRLSDCLTRALEVIGPVLGVAILATLAIGLASILLIIPGLIVAIILYVAVPVAVVERPGVMESLGRSVELTDGYRWQLFFVFVVVFVVVLVVGVTIQFILQALPFLGLTLSFVVGLAFEAFVGALASVLSAVAYLSLRQAKEGVDVDEIAAVFD